MSYLQDIPAHSGDNMGGLIELKVARAEDVATMAEPVDGVIYGDITFKEGAGFSRWYATRGTEQMDSRGKTEREGPGRDNALEFVIAKDQASIRRMLELAEEDALIVLYRDSNNQQKVLGTPESPAFFTFSASTGRRTSARNGFTCRFYSEGPDNSYFYNGTVSSAPGGSAPAVVLLGNGTLLKLLYPGDELILNGPFSIGLEYFDESEALNYTVTMITANENPVT